MNNIKPVTFLVPFFALALLCILYFFLSKKATNRKFFNTFLFTITILAFLLNFVWELIQIPLYRNSSYDIAHVLFCALASIADTIMVLLIYLGLAAIFEDLFWVKHLRLTRIVIVILIGGTGAVLSEMRHLSLGSWAYDDSMPVLPVFNVGISPLLQFMILPVLIYLLSFYHLRIMNKK